MRFIVSMVSIVSIAAVFTSKMVSIVGSEYERSNVGHWLDITTVDDFYTKLENKLEDVRHDSWRTREIKKINELETRRYYLETCEYIWDCIPPMDCCNLFGVKVCCDSRPNKKNPISLPVPVPVPVTIPEVKEP